MDEYQSTLKAGQIQFHEWCEPPLEPGDYTVDLHQAVTGLKTFDNDFSFSVAGPRFSLSPSEIYSVYPPKGQTGDFANTLPHIVFTRRTLPWERSVDPGPRQTGDKLPWMALLVLSAADFPEQEFPKIKALRVGELINPKPADAFVGPQLVTSSGDDGLAAYEKEADLCNVLELPWDLFQSVAPAKKDLAYLAHVREVNTGNKETLSFLADGWFSVVLANRLPEPERKGTDPPLPVENRAYLVSLEGLSDYLHGSGSTVNKPVRMAVLSSWSFRCREAFSFKAAMDILKVRLLIVPGLDSAQTDAEKQVNDAWKVGYTALNHSTRLGEKAVSWYRGPLVPLDLAKQTNFMFRPAADAALRYSPLDGMMDVSYAAAYQLGRLLALQDRHFATALYSYRSGVQQQINHVLGRKRVESIFGGMTGDNENEIMSSYLKNVGSPAATQVASSGWAAQQPAIQDKAGGTNSNELNLTTDFDLTIPQAVCRWLARLVLLYRIPFTNLVADERMLPPDSIRFFYLDPNWLKCLLEGACSVGRSSARDELVDEYLRGKFLDFAMEQSLGVRTRTPAAGASDPVAVKHSPAKLPNWPLTGFLLRSPAVEGWQGLEMQAWMDTGETQPLEPLRIDRLAPDIMLCIYNGKVDRIEVKQPPEGMHFGASVVGDGFQRMHLRRLNDKTDANDEPDRVKPGPGNQLTENTKTNIPLRSQDVKRVVKVFELAQALKKTLDDIHARVDGTEFTSADFGVEMVESPGRVVFDVNNSKDGQ